MNHDGVREWIERYESAWRTAGTDRLAELFADNVRYRVSPWAEPIVGLDAVAAFWDGSRDGPAEEFSMESEIVAVEGDTAVVRVDVDYPRNEPASWRDLWIVRFDGSGRSVWFEEWPFAPGQPDGQS